MAGFEITFEAVDQASPTIQRLSQQLLEAAQRSDRFAGQVVASTTKADQGFKKLPASANAAAQSMSAVQSAAGQLLNQLAGFATVAGIGAFFKSAADEALGEEEALRRLQFAVEATGGSFAREKESIVAFANEQQALTRFSDTQAFEALGRLTRVTGDVGQAMQATRLAFGLASASGKDFNTVIEQLAPILQGDASRLRELKKEFGAFLGDADTAQEVLDALSQRFVGAAESESGFARQLASLRNRLGDFKEVIGAAVLPVFRGFLEAVLSGAQFFEILGTVIANFAAKAVVHLEGLGAKTAAVFRGQFERLPEISQETAAKLAAIEEASAAQAAEVQRRYSQEKQKLVQQEVELKASANQKSIEQARKEADEKKRQAQDAHDKLVQLEAERLENEGRGLEARLLLINQEKEQRFRQFEELRAKGLITEDELLQARLASLEIAALKSAEAGARFNEDLQAIEAGGKAVASSIASNFSSAVADVILEGKSLEQAMDQVFKSVLRTAIETFTRIAIEAAIARTAASGALGPIGGALLFGAIALPAFKGFKFAEGGVVRKPTLGMVGEAGPEAVIPLDQLGRLGGNINVSVSQTNHITVTGMGDEQVRQLMRRISEATRTGAAEGAELVKSILARQGRLSKEAV
jgi:hypothetical protein